MKRKISLLLSLLLLGGCLEVEQHPVWENGTYNGKRDDLAQRAHFHNDKFAWNAAIYNRNGLQNEYQRTRP
jgi:PBP1b-binding outer membrane lipoprotein LpoB